MESLVMSVGSRRPYMEDAILDLLLSMDLSNVSSLMDLKNLCQDHLKKWLETDASFSFADLADRLAIKMTIWKQSSIVPDGSKLGKLIRSMKRTELSKELLVLYTRSSDIPTLSLSVPVISESDDESIKSLSHLIELACLTHSVKPENIRITGNSKFDKKISMSSTFWKLVDNLKASAKSTTGDYPSANVTFSGSRYISTPVGLLASMRLLQTKDFLLRRSQRKDNVVLTYFQLQQRFNDILGIRAEDSKSFAVQMLKGILASCVKPHNVGFPGGWIHKKREVNKVKSDAGLIQLMGWTEKIVSPYKLQEVLFNTVDSTREEKDQSKVIGRSMVNLSQKGRNMSFQEFRTAVCLTVPRLDLKDLKTLDSQSKVEPLDWKNQDVCERFSTNEFVSMTDSLNVAFAFKVNLKNPKSKTNLVHYENARGKLIGMTANKPITDQSGNKYDTFSDLPNPVQSFLRKKYRYPIKRPNKDDDISSPLEKMEGVQSSVKAITQVTAKKGREEIKASRPAPGSAKKATKKK